MQYLGGKGRVGKYILQNLPVYNKRVWEPFCGGLSFSELLAPWCSSILVSDIHAPLIHLIRAVRDGWNPPLHLTEEEYHAARFLPAHNPLHAFAGFGASFGGKWFAGYAGDERIGSPHTIRGSATRLVEKVKALQKTEARIECIDFCSGVVPNGSGFGKPRFDLIYCDPPYSGTEDYGNSFDHSAFWNVCRDWAQRGITVFVSEYSAPQGVECVWMKKSWVSIGGLNKTNTRTERLYRVSP